MLPLLRISWGKIPNNAIEICYSETFALEIYGRFPLVQVGHLAVFGHPPRPVFAKIATKVPCDENL